mmetsp:Transcript_107523/g.286103  ORF Transcript_107523/g.286103 Transcript_107523/m.286103 type:complete len:183 (-) Transcript_107523:104-652(-)|eukprot:CAMPEP_0171200306 /NCGR_PEP_ID=MMETSP0790-20130122/23912_1 /TAXON_ID=2925 /ORGANISM="Alexandrium catenella, Strain OF101" /LENGTH=182 /DNA_ID=CAMNT_0011665681 /DNA_START=23 /DNA_END=571 /DNA_ORIENTATION=-
MSKHNTPRAFQVLLLIVAGGALHLTISTNKASPGAFVAPQGRRSGQQARRTSPLRAHREATDMGQDLLSNDFDIAAERARLNDVMKLEIEELEPEPQMQSEEFDMDDWKRLASLIFSIAYVAAAGWLLYTMLFDHDHVSRGVTSDITTFLALRYILKAMREERPPRRNVYNDKFVDVRGASP